MDVFNFRESSHIATVQKARFCPSVSAKKADCRPKLLDAPNRNEKWRPNCQKEKYYTGCDALNFFQKHFFLIRTVRKRVCARFANFNAYPTVSLRIQNPFISHHDGSQGIPGCWCHIKKSGSCNCQHEKMLFFHFYVVSWNGFIRARYSPHLGQFAIKQAKKSDPQCQNCQEHLFLMLCLCLPVKKETEFSNVSH